MKEFVIMAPSILILYSSCNGCEESWRSDSRNVSSRRKEVIVDAALSCLLFGSSQDTA